MSEVEHVFNLSEEFIFERKTFEAFLSIDIHKTMACERCVRRSCFP